MDFSLSSSLVGSAVSNPDKLALDLQFATDKTLTARKGPTPVFIRGSNATVVGSNGLVRYAPNNSSLYSGQLVVGTGWSANATPSVTSIVDGLGPDGNNAYEVAEVANIGSHTLFNTGGTGTTGATSVVSGITYTGSIFVKKVAGSVNWIQLSFSTVGFGSTQYANFNISNGTIGNFSSSSPQIQDAGNGWYRCSISAAATATTTTTSNLFTAFTNNIDTTIRLISYAGNTVNKVLAAMCQFEIGSTVNTYNPTTTAAFQGPRFDHDPVTLACKGLLIEESRTNNSWYSGAIVTNIGWLLSQVTSVIDVASIDGKDAYLITEDSSTNTHSVANTGGATGTAATSVVSGTTYTGSIFVKKSPSSVDWIQLTLGSIGFGTAQYANFNLSTGAAGNSAGCTARIEQFSNGWYRCSVSAAATATTTTSVGLAVFLTNNANVTARAPSYAGSTANKVLAAMCQFETGAFPTSYIPTTTASVIRSADVCSISGSAFSGFYNQLEGSLACNYAITTGFTGNRYPASIEDATGGTQNGFVFRNTNVAAMFVAGAGPSSTIGAVSTGVSKHILAYSGLSEFVYVKDSVVGTTTGSGTRDPSLPIRMSIGSLEGSNAFTLCGHISSIRYFKKRLSNAKLQAITV